MYKSNTILKGLSYLSNEHNVLDIDTLDRQHRVMLVTSFVFRITSSSIIFVMNIYRLFDIDDVLRDSSHSIVNTAE